jgi:NAD(P)-dependent dehydrogenase (short-subunit alcohol dehydrogenase family)
MVMDMELGLKDRRVLITGGSSGIGRAAAIAFAREGARVAITYRGDHAGATRTAEATGAVAARLDLADADGVWRAIGDLAERLGGIDVLVNNAAETTRHAEAFDPSAPGFADTPPERWRPLLVTGLEGVFHTLQAALPAMSGGWGRIAFVSSGAAERGGPREEAYAASKAALTGLTASLARELGPAGILVNIVMPALTTTERVVSTVPEPVRTMIAGHAPTRRLSTPDDVANTLLFLCSTANGNITGETVRVTGGL